LVACGTSAGKNLSTDDQICQALALLEIEHKKVPVREKERAVMKRADRSSSGNSNT
jgi:hypothetical protein